MGNEVSAEQEAPAAPDPPPLTGTVPVCLLWPHGGKTAYICGSFTQWQKMPMQWRQAGASGEWFKVVDLTPGTHQYKFIIDGQWRHDHTAPTVLDNLGNVNNCTHVQLPVGSGAGAGAGADADAATSAGESGGAGAGKAAEQPTGGRAGRPPDAEPEEDLGHDPRGRASGAASRTSLQSGVSGCSSNGLGAWPSDPYLSTARPRPESYGQVVPAREELLVHHTASLLLPPQLRLLLPQHHGDSTTMPLAVQMNHLFCNLRDDVSILAVAHRYKDRSVTQLLYKPGMVTIRARSHAAAAASAGVAGVAGAAAGVAPVRRSSELRHISRDVQLQSVRVPGSQRDRDENGLEFTVYLVDSVLVVHGVQTTLRSDRRYKHFQLLHQLLLKEFATLIPQALPPRHTQPIPHHPDHPSPPLTTPPPPSPPPPPPPTTPHRHCRPSAPSATCSRSLWRSGASPSSDTCSCASRRPRSRSRPVVVSPNIVAAAAAAAAVPNYCCHYTTRSRCRRPSATFSRPTCLAATFRSSTTRR